MTNPMKDIEENSNAIFIIGSNTSEQHPVFGYKIRRAVMQRGVKLIVADPRRISITDFATLHLQHKPGTDIALVNGIAHIILENNWEDEQFIAERCEEFEDYAESLNKYTPEFVSKITEVSITDLKEAAEILAKNSPMAVLWAMGITQHTTGVMNVFSLANLQMLLGNMGKPGGGCNPLRGQNNVQGACDMGALVNVFPGYQKVVDEKVREKFNSAWKLGNSNGKNGDSLFGELPGKTVTEMTSGALSGDVRGLYIIGENPVMSDPDSNHVRKAFTECEFMVLQEIFPSETSKFADVLLPSVTFAEKTGSFTNTERRIQPISPAIKGKGNALPDWKITSMLANKIIDIEGKNISGLHSGWNYESPNEIMEEISSLAPIYGGVNYSRIRSDEELHWPILSEEHPGTPILHVGEFSRGKGKFHLCEQIDAEEMPTEDYPLILTTGRVLYHWHGAEMTRRVQGLVDIYPESLVEINPADAEKLGILENDKIKVTSRRGEMIAKAFVTDRVSAGVIFGNFHYPGEQNVNNLTIAASDPTAKIPEFKVCAIKVEKISLD